MDSERAGASGGGAGAPCAMDDPCRAPAFRALWAALNARHSPLCTHAERVAQTATLIAGGLGWRGAQSRRLREAALLHDVGMIGVIDAVLLDPRPLHTKARTHLELHVELGDWLTSEALDAEQRAWIHGHHERWDGAGYPQGPRG